MLNIISVIDIHYAPSQWDKRVGIVNYALHQWASAGGRLPESVIQKVKEVIADHPGIQYAEENFQNGVFKIILTIPEHIYTLTQIKYSEYITDDFT